MSWANVAQQCPLCKHPFVVSNCPPPPDANWVVRVGSAHRFFFGEQNVLFQEEER